VADVHTRLSCLQLYSPTNYEAAGQLFMGLAVGGPSGAWTTVATSGSTTHPSTTDSVPGGWQGRRGPVVELELSYPW
jgi:hypothetical protein